MLRLVARGMANREIAQQLFISENTVKNHVRNILEKLHLHSRMEAAVYAAPRSTSSTRTDDVTRLRRRATVSRRGAARRIALAAQGFARPAARAVAGGTRHLQRVIDRVGVVQIDSVNVVVRSHYLPFFSRLGPYDRDPARPRPRPRAPAARRVLGPRGRLVPPSTWPLLDFRMRRARSGRLGRHAAGGARAPRARRGGPRRGRAPRPADQPRQVEAALAHDLPRAARRVGLELVAGQERPRAPLLVGRDHRAPGAPRQFERRYAALGRVLPPAVARAGPRPGAAADRTSEAFRELVEIAARAHGVGTEQCLRDYFRLKPEQARPAIASLVAEGALIPATIEGWARPAYLHPQARRPRKVHGAGAAQPVRLAHLAARPHRGALRLRLPARDLRARRTCGCTATTCCRSSSASDLVARCDLKADRAAGVLRVHAVHWEPGAPAEARPALDAELAHLACWLGLDAVA